MNIMPFMGLLITAEDGNNVLCFLEWGAKLNTIIWMRHMLLKEKNDDNHITEKKRTKDLICQDSLTINAFICLFSQGFHLIISLRTKIHIECIRLLADIKLMFFKDELQ